MIKDIFQVGRNSDLQEEKADVNLDLQERMKKRRNGR